MHRWLSLVFVFTIACASQLATRPKSVAQPSIEPRLANEPFFASSSSAPISIEVTVQNRATVPIMVRRLEIDSPGMSTYTMSRVVRDVRETIEPGQSKNFSVFGTLTTLVSHPTEPLALRAIVELQAEGTVWREIVMRR